MRNEIIVAVVDTGISFPNLAQSVKDRLYWNDGEVAGNGRDDDGNGLVDDVTGPSTGPASNGWYQEKEGSGHGLGMVKNVCRELDAAEEVLGRDLPVSIMPVSMYTGGYYANIVAAAEAGASVISLSHNLTYGQKAYISKLLEPYDVIAVTVDRDDPGEGNPDAGEEGRTAFDNVIEVALVSEAIVRGNVEVDLLEIGSNLHNKSESHAIAKTAGKIAAIWGVDPSRAPGEVLELVAASTDRDHPTIQSQGLHSEMGGRIDLARAMALASGAEEEDRVQPQPQPEPQPEPEPETRDLNRVEADGGYLRASGGDDLVLLGEDRAVVFGNGGDDVFRFNERPGREHVIRDFAEGDALDLDALTGGDLDRIDLGEASWNGATHTRVLVEEGGAWSSVAVLHDIHDVALSDILL